MDVAAGRDGGLVVLSAPSGGRSTILAIRHLFDALLHMFAAAFDIFV